MKDKVFVDLAKKPLEGMVRNDRRIKLDIEGLMMGSIEENVQAQLENFCKEDGGIKFEGIISITTPYLKEDEIVVRANKSFDNKVINCNDMYTDVTWLYRPTLAN